MPTAGLNERRRLSALYAETHAEISRRVDGCQRCATAAPGRPLAHYSEAALLHRSANVARWLQALLDRVGDNSFSTLVAHKHRLARAMLAGED